MFHVEHYFLSFLAAAAWVAAAGDFCSRNNISHDSQMVDEITRVQVLNIPMASESEKARYETSVGMLDLLLGWDESAHLHFKTALEADSRCALAYCGVLISQRGDDHWDDEGYLQRQVEITSQIRATPVEAFYLSVFTKILSKDLVGAAEDCCTRADQYKADLFSAYWAIVLLHCIDYGYTAEGRPEHYQGIALERITDLYSKRPGDPCVCFLRAYVEESAPVISTEALEAARKAVKLLPGHPVPEQLLGHLLYRSGSVEESIHHFHQAALLAYREDIPESESTLVWKARLYEATAQWSSKRDKEALASRRRMNAISFDREKRYSGGSILQHWEAATLPLRILIRREKLPTIGEISAAAEVATLHPPLEDDPIIFVRDCLRATLYARLKGRASRITDAVRSLRIAEDAFEKFQSTRHLVREKSIDQTTPWLRAEEACIISLNIARAEIFKKTAELWTRNAQEAVRPADLLLPPIVPERADLAGSDRK